MFLDKLAELELHVASARTWLQRAADAFLIDPSHSLINASVKNTFRLIAIAILFPVQSYIGVVFAMSCCLFVSLS